MSPPRKYVINPGDTFGRLTVTREIRVPRKSDASVTERGALCTCKCGKTVTVLVSNLCSNTRTESCGCLLREHMAQLGRDLAPGQTHGFSNHPLYHTHYMMLDRCYNGKSRGYEYYGGRGIRVCDRWHDIRLFIQDIDRDLGPRPRGKTLDRISSNSDYEPGKVRWATPVEQAQNRRRPRKRSSNDQFTP